MSDVIEAEYLGISKVFRNGAITFNWIECHRKHKQWLARIDGIDPKFGFKRVFLNSSIALVEKQPKLRAHKWELQFGYIYQYSNFMVDHITDKLTSGFFITNLNGIIPIEYEQVRLYLRMPVKNRAMIKELTFMDDDKSKTVKDYVADDVDF